MTKCASHDSRHQIYDADLAFVRSAEESFAERMEAPGFEADTVQYVSPDDVDATIG